VNVTKTTPPPPTPPMNYNLNLDYDIVFAAEPHGQKATGSILRQSSLSGTDQHVIFLAEEFARRGLRVLSLVPIQHFEFHEGVTYAPLSLENIGIKTKVLVDVRFGLPKSTIEHHQRIYFCTCAVEVVYAQDDYFKHLWTDITPEHRAKTDLFTVSQFQINIFRASPLQGWKSQHAIPAILPTSVLIERHAPRFPHRYIYASAVRKGLPETLTLWTEMLPQLPADAELIITGPGYDADRIPQPLPPRVRYLGSLSFESFIQEMRDCGGMFFVNTYTECFPFPLAVATHLGLRTHVLLRAGNGGMHEITQSEFVTQDEATFKKAVLEHVDDPWDPKPVRLDFLAANVADRWLEKMPLLQEYARSATSL
jgi:hypothetical protein